MFLSTFVRTAIGVSADGGGHSNTHSRAKSSPPEPSSAATMAENKKTKGSMPSSSNKIGPEINVPLYHKLLDGWAVEIIEVSAWMSLN